MGSEAASTTIAGQRVVTIIAPLGARGLVSAADAAWFAEAAAALGELVAEGGCFTVEAIREAVEPPTGSGAFGALMTSAARAGWIRAVGQVASAWPSRHGGAVTLWRAARRVGGGAA